MQGSAWARGGAVASRRRQGVGEVRRWAGHNGARGASTVLSFPPSPSAPSPRQAQVGGKRGAAAARGRTRGGGAAGHGRQDAGPGAQLDFIFFNTVRLFDSPK